jgi:hypothetical protein
VDVGLAADAQLTVKLWQIKAVPLPPCRRQGLLLIFDIGTRWGEWSVSRKLWQM